jgi:hypothetical protein
VNAVSLRMPSALIRFGIELWMPKLLKVRLMSEEDVGTEDYHRAQRSSEAAERFGLTAILPNALFTTFR